MFSEIRKMRSQRAGYVPNMSRRFGRLTFQPMCGFKTADTVLEQRVTYLAVGLGGLNLSNFSRPSSDGEKLRAWKCPGDKGPWSSRGRSGQLAVLAQAADGSPWPWSEESYILYCVLCAVAVLYLPKGKSRDSRASQARELEAPHVLDPGQLSRKGRRESTISRRQATGEKGASRK